jgi:hypothetical protein
MENTQNVTRQIPTQLFKNMPNKQEHIQKQSDV